MTLGGLATSGELWACGLALIAGWYLQQTGAANDTDYNFRVRLWAQGRHAGMQWRHYVITDTSLRRKATVRQGKIQPNVKPVSKLVQRDFQA